jgi:hypothetical protein
MKKDEISPKEKVERLSNDLGTYHKSSAFQNCRTMGELVEAHLNHYLSHKIGR